MSSNRGNRRRPTSKELKKLGERGAEADRDFTLEATPEMIESFSKDFTRGLPDAAFEQIDQEIKGFSMGSRAAIKGYKYGGVK